MLGCNHDWELIKAQDGEPLYYVCRKCGETT